MKRADLLAFACLAACSPPRLVTSLRYSAVAGARDEPFRATPPPLAGVSGIVDAPPWSFTLPNGLRMLLFPRHDYPIVAARLLVDRGALDLDDPGALQVAQAMFLFGRGGSEAAFDALRADEARIGERFGQGVSRSTVWVGARARADGFDTLLEDLERLTFGARLESVECDVRSAEWVQSARATGPSIASAERFVLFGDRHAYGFAGHGREPLPLEAARAIHERLFQPAYASLVVVGDVAPDQVEPSVERVFGPVLGVTSLAKRTEPPPPESGPRLAMIRYEGLTQMRGSVFARGPAPSSHDIFPFSVMAHLLGSGPFSQLFERVREEAGAAYAVGAWAPVERTASWISLDASYDADKAVNGVGTVLATVRDLRAGKVADEEIALAREGVIAQWREQLSTADGAADAYCATIALGVGTDWVRDLPTRIANVRKEDVIRVANQYLKDGAMHVVFQGDDRWFDPGALGMGGATRLDLTR